MKQRNSMLKPIYNFFHRHYHLRYHNQYVHAKKLFVFDLFLLALAIGILGAGLFFFFWRPGLTDWIDLKLSYEGGRLTSGEKTTLIIDYANRSKYSLKNVTLAVHLPKGFVIDRSATLESIFSDESTITIDEIKPGAKSKKMIRGTIWTEPTKEEKILAILSYTPENSNTREQKFGEFLLNLPASILETEVDFAAKNTLPKSSYPISIGIKNNSEDIINNVSLSIDWAGKVSIEKIDDLFDLKPGEIKKFNGIVEMPDRQSGEYKIIVNTAVKVNQQTITQNSFSAPIQIISPQTNVEAKWLTETKYAEPKMILPVQISWKNNSVYELKNQRVRVGLTAGVVDTKATARENNLKIENGELILDSSNQTILANGKSGDSGTAKINLILLPTFSVGEKENAYLEILPRFEASITEMPGQNFVNNGISTRIILSTEVSLSSEVRYFTIEGDQLGRGPLPPRVGETTKYWVFVSVKNTTNSLINAGLNITLASDAKMTGKQSVTLGSALVVNGDKISWSAPQIPANSTMGVYFEVAVTPTVEQVRKKLKLVHSVQFNGEDVTTGKSYTLSRGELSNMLSPNDRGVNMGFLVE